MAHAVQLQGYVARRVAVDLAAAGIQAVVMIKVVAALQFLPAGILVITPVAAL